MHYLKQIIYTNVILILLIIRLSINEKSAGMMLCCLLQQLSSKQLSEVAVQHKLIQHIAATDIADI